MAQTDTMTLQQAVAAVPAAQWSDQAGEAWTTNEILQRWPQQQLDQPVAYAEAAGGMTAIRGRDGIILTMIPPEGFDIAPEPPVPPSD